MQFTDALQGIKVLDFSWVAAGPVTSLWFANFGATVIKVEHAGRLDTVRGTSPFKGDKYHVDGSYWFASCNTNKYGITLDLNKPKGMEIAHRLVRWADVIVENFSPGTMKKWGLDYERVRAINERVIMVSLSTQGQTGPHAQSPGLGAMVMGLSGASNLGGWPDRPPSCAITPYPDWVAPLGASFSVVSALDYRERTGKGQYIDLSQCEATIQFLGGAVLDYTVNGRVWQRAGNQLIASETPYAAPHGAYPCRGDDRWIAIAVFSDQEWERLLDLMGRPDWSRDHKFSTLLSRCEHTEDLDKHMALWTAGFEPRPLMELLQANGITAGVVHDQRGVYEDPQLNSRGHFSHLEHPVLGRYHVEVPAAHLSETPARMRKAAPTLGGDNDYVYLEVLGLSQDEYDLLIAEEVISLFESG